MTLQARSGQWDHRFYNVNRDVAHNFADVVMEVAKRLEDKQWPILKEVLDDYNVTEEQIGEACSAFCTFVLTCTDEKKDTMALCLTRSGWFKTPDIAQLAFMSILGTVMAGYFFAGARDATLGGIGPVATMDELRAYGRVSAKLLTVPKWKQRLYVYKAWAMEVFDALKGNRAQSRSVSLLLLMQQREEEKLLDQKRKFKSSENPTDDDTAESSESSNPSS